MAYVVITISRMLTSLFAFTVCLFSALNVLRRLYTLLWMTSWRKQNLGDLFTSHVKQRGRDAIAMLHLEDKWTFGFLDDFSNQIGHFLNSKGVKHQENIALFMESEPRFVGVWLGAAKVRRCQLIN